MKRARIKKVIIIICVLLIIAIIAVIGSTALYLKLFGKSLVENAVSKAVGQKVTFKEFSIDLENNRVVFNDFKIPGRMSAEGAPFFRADSVTATIDGSKFRKNRKIVLQVLVVDNGTLHLERNKNGTFNIAFLNGGEPGIFGEEVAYAYEAFSNRTLYNMAQQIEEIVIRNSTFEFSDSTLYGVPFVTTFDTFNFKLTSKKIPSGGSIPVTCKFGFRIPAERYNRDGWLYVESSMAVYDYQVNMEATVQTEYIDVMKFLPYFQFYTPFQFNEGLFSSSTKFKMHSNYIDLLTTMVFHRLRLSVNPAEQNARFLSTTANRIIPYLTSREGDIVFDWVAYGPSDNLQFNVGPRVKQAMGMIAAEEITNVLQSLQSLSNF